MIVIADTGPLNYLILIGEIAWFLLHRVRLAMQDGLNGGMLSGEVEVDETYIGGKARNMHRSKKLRINQAMGGTGLQGGSGKAVGMGMLERGGKVVASVIPDRTEGAYATHRSR